MTFFVGLFYRNPCAVPVIVEEWLYSIRRGSD